MFHQLKDKVVISTTTFTFAKENKRTLILFLYLVLGKLDTRTCKDQSKAWSATEKSKVLNYFEQWLLFLLLIKYKISKVCVIINLQEFYGARFGWSKYQRASEFGASAW